MFLLCKDHVSLKNLENNQSVQICETWLIYRATLMLLIGCVKICCVLDIFADDDVIFNFKSCQSAKV